MATLAANAHCSVSINFTPAAVGALMANLQVADNAPGSPQTLVLNGTGIAPAPAVTFSPPAPSFPATNQGASSAGGAASIATPPPPIVTPSGTSTITISLSATSSTGQPLQLQPIPLTLAVK